MKKIMIVLMMLISITLIINAEWGFTVSTDKMTGETIPSCYSEYTQPTYEMDSPYGDTECFLALSKYEPSYIGIGIIFTNQPNLNDTENDDGYNIIKTRIKFGDDVEYITMKQEWGSKVLVVVFDSLKDKEEFINKLKEHDEMLLELKWYGQGNVYFPIKLDGSTKFINKVLNFN